MSYNLNIKVLKSIYRAECVIKAAYLLIDKAYVLIDEDDKYWIVNFQAKDDKENVTELEGSFKNELLAQVVRLNVYNQTKNVREMLLARAISTSIVDNETTVSGFDNDIVSPEDLKDILTDWFDKNEK